MSADILQFPNGEYLKNKSPSLEPIEQKNCQANINKSASILKHIKKIIVRYGWCAPALARFLLNRLKLKEV